MDGARFFLFRLSFIFLLSGGVGVLVRTTALYAQWGRVLLFSTLFILRDYILASHPSSVPFFCSTSFLLFLFSTSWPRRFACCMLALIWSFVLIWLLTLLFFREIGRPTTWRGERRDMDIWFLSINGLGGSGKKGWRRKTIIFWHLLDYIGFGDKACYG